MADHVERGVAEDALERVHIAVVAQVLNRKGVPESVSALA
jgi:hypothetical protein